MSLPDEPQYLSLVSKTGGSVTLSWVAPVDTGGINITGYDVIYFTGYRVGADYQIVTANVSALANGALSTKLTGLFANTSYGFIVVATNGVTACFDMSTFLNYFIIYTTTPSVSVPDIPGSLSTNVSTGGMQTVMWTPSQDSGGDTFISYLLFSESGEILMNDTQAKYYRGGLKPNTSYGYAVAAWNSAGTSLRTALYFGKTKETATVPGAPSLLQVTSTTGGSIGLIWTSPIDTGGVELIGYSVFRNELLVSESILTYTSFLDDHNLASNGMYVYTCQAINEVGAGSVSDQLFAGTSAPTPPQSPQNILLQANGGVLNVFWTAPGDTGGIALKHYQVNIFSDIGLATDIITSSESAVYYGIEANTQYNVSLVAVNAIGDSNVLAAYVTNGNATRPAAPPAPSVIAVTAESIVLGLNISSDDGGSPVTELNLYMNGAKVQSEDTLQGFTQFRVNQLHARTNYSFSATAKSIESLGESNFSASVSVMTANPTPPSNLYNFALLRRTSSSLTFDWDGPDETGGDDLTYELAYNDDTANTTIIVEGTTNPLDIYGLSPTTTYEIRARVNNSAGVSEWTDNIYAETDVAQRGVITFKSNSMKVFENASSITIDLVRVNGTAGNITCELYVDNSSTAVDGSDYGLPGALKWYFEFAAGESKQSFDIEISDNSVYNPVVRTIVLVLDDITVRSDTVLLTNMTIGIYDDGDAGWIDFAIPEINISEGVDIVNIPLRRLNGSSSTTSVQIFASDTATATALMNSSFTIISSEIAFADGETSQNASVAIINNSAYDYPYLYFYLQLAVDSGGGQIGDNRVIQVTILDDGDRSAPGIVRDVSQSKATGGMFTINWIPPVNVGGTVLWITQYNITINLGSSTKCLLTADNSTQLDYNDVVVLTGYTIQIAAVNIIGQGNFSAGTLVSTTNYTKPGIISTIALERATGGLLQVLITPPFDFGGAPIIGYKVYYSEADEDSFRVSILNFLLVVFVLPE